MSSVNLIKLLSSCNILQSGTIVPAVECPCHNKIDNEESLEILTSGPEPILRCFKCGNSYCATSYMMGVLRLKTDEVLNNLLQCGFGIKESEFLINKAIKYLRLLNVFESGRHIYREKVQIDERRVNSFGDWSQLSGSVLNSIFFRRSTSKLSQSSDYSVLMLRDENGIPSKCLIYTLLGSYIGEAKIPIPSGKLSILSERWVDFVSWTNRVMLTDSAGLCSNVSRSLVDSEGKTDFPVCVLLSSESSATFFSKLPPKIDVILGAEEKSYKFSCLYNNGTDVYIYRLPTDNLNLMAVTGKFEDEIHRMKPATIIRDILCDLKINKKTDTKSFCNEILKMHNCSDRFRNELIDSFCLETGEDKKRINESIAIFGTSINSFVAGNKRFKIHNNSYHELMLDWSMRQVSNFWINIDTALCSPEGSIEYECTIFIGDNNLKFYVQHDDFFDAKKLFKKINSLCVINSLEYPFWNSSKSIFELSPMIIRGLNSSKINTIKKEIYGVYKDTLTTKNWICDKFGVRLCNSVIGDCPFDIKNPLQINNIQAYNNTCKKQIQNMCLTKFGSEVFASALQTIYNLIKNDSCHFVSNKYILSAVSEVLGISSVDNPTKTRMPQYIEKILRPKEASKNACTLSIIDRDQKYGKKFITLQSDTNPIMISNTEPMLLFIFQFCLLNINSNYLKEIESMLINSESIYNFREAISKINSQKNELDSFIWRITQDHNLSKLIRNEKDSTIIYVKIFSELESLGYHFKKKDIIKLLKQSGNRVEYPLIDKENRKISLKIYAPNKIWNAINEKNNKWKTTRHISIK